jgi:transposase InsO family protein
VGDYVRRRASLSQTSVAFHDENVLCCANSSLIISILNSQGSDAAVHPYRLALVDGVWLRNTIDATITIEHFRRQYNEIRPRSSLGQLTPVEFKQKLPSTNYPEQAIS